MTLLAARIGNRGFQNLARWPGRRGYYDELEENPLRGDPTYSDASLGEHGYDTVAENPLRGAQSYGAGPPRGEERGYDEVPDAQGPARSYYSDAAPSLRGGTPQLPVVPAAALPPRRPVGPASPLRGEENGYDEVPQNPLRGAQSYGKEYATELPDLPGVGSAYSDAPSLRGGMPQLPVVPAAALPPRRLPVVPGGPLRGEENGYDEVPDARSPGRSYYSDAAPSLRGGMPQLPVVPAAALPPRAWTAAMPSAAAGGAAPPRPRTPAPALPASGPAAPPRPMSPAPALPAYDLKSVRSQHEHEADVGTQFDAENRDFVISLVNMDKQVWDKTDATRRARGEAPIDRAAEFRNKYGWTPEDYDRFINKREKRAVQYLRSEADRAGYKIRAQRGQIVKDKDGTVEPADTSAMSSKFGGVGYGIFVMSPSGELYLGQHKVGLFHHSSFLGGGQTAGAGEMKIDQGALVAITNKSGHYFPEYTQFKQVVRKLSAGGVDLTRVRAMYFHSYYDINTSSNKTDVHRGPASDILNMTMDQFIAAHPVPPRN